MRFALVLLAATILAAQAPPVPPLYQPTPEELRQMEQKSAELDAALRPLRGKAPDDLLVDVEVYLKAAQWILRFHEFYSKANVTQTLAVLDTGLQRAGQLAANKPEWSTATGSLCRAYRSRVDGSIQPYALTISPYHTNGNDPEWLEVVLHGRGATLTEASFLYTHDRAKPEKQDHQFLQLDVFGRGNNAYRWAGETDVFEAIESVRKRYRIDSDRIVLRGFSMGGAGAWHLGLHYPDKWAAFEAGAGFVETQAYASVENPPPYVHIYDALDYARNAFNVPLVGYGGEDDPQLRASVLIRQEMEKEGYRFQAHGMKYTSENPPAMFLIGPKTPHRWHPDSHKESTSFVTHHQSRGTTTQGDTRFVTYTERYNHVFWLTVDQLARQYQRAQVDGETNKSGAPALKLKTSNVARLTVRDESQWQTITVDDQTFDTKRGANTFERVGGNWRTAKPYSGFQKIHGLQGPIDDAFMESFLCIRPAGTPPQSPVNRFALEQLDRFGQEFAHYMRGDIRIKTVKESTASDSRDHNIVAFGTPLTNPLIARALQATSIHWTAQTITVGNRKFDASNHMLSMIYPSPDNRSRYIVINSGHTFHEADFKGTNALLYPRVGDWAVTDVRTGVVAAEGIFDRNWQLPAAK